MESAKCEACSKPCQECTGTALTCTQCDPNVDSKYLVGNQCVAECPSNSVPTLNSKTSGVCETCSPNCGVCSGTKDNCLSCPSGYLLNLVGNENNCVNNCPVGVSVPNLDLKVPACEPCNPNCLTCSASDRNYCTSCRKSFNLFQGLCSLECDTKTNK